MLTWEPIFIAIFRRDEKRRGLRRFSLLSDGHARRSLSRQASALMLFSMAPGFRTDPEPDRIHGGQEHQRHDGSPQRPANQGIGERPPEHRMGQRNERQNGGHGRQ